MPHSPLTFGKIIAVRNPSKDLRKSSAMRGYGRRWRRLRLLILRAYPLCIVEDCDEAATDVDHIIPLAEGGNDSAENLQALCHAHHSRKTAMSDGGWGWSRGG